MVRIINIEPQTIEQETIKKQTETYLYNLKNEIDTEKIDFRNFNVSKYIFENKISGLKIYNLKNKDIKEF